jgi:hypothetical protein
MYYVLIYNVHRNGCGMYRHKLPALALDSRLSEFFGEALFTQTLVNVRFILVFVLKTDEIRGEKLQGALQRRCCFHFSHTVSINTLNAELNPICYLLALLAHHFLHVSRISVKSLTLGLLMSYIYGAPILEVSRSHTTTQHSRLDSSGRVISSSQRPLSDDARHSQQTNIHALSGIRTHDLSRRV